MTEPHPTLPAARAAVADPGLWRPDWTGNWPRDPKRLWLDKNENTDPALQALVVHLLGRIAPANVNTYPDSGPLYRKLAAHLGVEPCQLVLTAGSDGAIRAAFEAYVDPGDCVVITKPTFAMYAVYARMYGADVTALEYRAAADGPELDVGDFVRAIDAQRPKLVCLPNPDSPTGTVFDPVGLRVIVEAAGRAGALMLIDEAYFPFYPHSVIEWIKDCPHLMVTRSTGKAWGMAGLRIGYAVASPEVAATLHKVRPMYETNTIAVALFEAMLDQQEAMLSSVARLQAGKQRFAEAMRGFGFAVLNAHGNFLHVAFAGHAEAVHAALEPIAYYRKDFGDPCLKGFSRFSATTVEGFAPVIEAIGRVVADRRNTP